MGGKKGVFEKRTRCPLAYTGCKGKLEKKKKRIRTPTGGAEGTPNRTGIKLKKSQWQQGESQRGSREKKRFLKRKKRRGPKGA